MSRIGNKIIAVPSGVQIQVKDSLVEVKGPKGLIQVAMNPRIKVEKGSDGLVCKRPSDEKPDRALHGTMRSLLSNAVKGVTDGFKKEFEIVGIGYRAALDKKKIVFTVGYSHLLEIELPEDLSITFDEKNKNKFTLHGVDKQKVGQYAAHIRNV